MGALPSWTGLNACLGYVSEAAEGSGHFAGMSLDGDAVRAVGGSHAEMVGLELELELVLVLVLAVVVDG